MKALMAGNWKMNKTIMEAVAFVNLLKNSLKNQSECGVLLCVPFTALQSVSEACKGTQIMVGAQDIFYEEKGAFTGAISPTMIKESGATFTLVGHSERRMLFGETDDLVNKKIKAALAHGITPILCIGESLEERDGGKLKEVLTKQLTHAFLGLSSTEVSRVVVAYEPIWAIGTGKTASPKDADDAHAKVRVIIASLYNTDVADVMLVLYGGSVKADNVDELMAMDNINGALIGGASLEVESFSSIANFNKNL